MENPWLSSWPKDVPQHIEYPLTSLDELLRNSAAASPKQVAINYFGSCITFKELDDLADKFGAALQSTGIEKGDRVAIYLPNVPQFVIAYYGALRAGAIVVACSPLYKEREIGHILKDSGAKVIVAWDKLYPFVRSVASETKLTGIVTTSVRDYLPSALRLLSPLKGVKSYPCPGAKDMKGLLDAAREPMKPVQIEPSKDLALLQYTGGTTGIPKGAMLTHSNLVANIEQVRAWGVLRPEEVHLSVLPLFHIFGMTVAMNSPIYMRSTMVMLPDPRDIPGVIKAIEKYRPAIFCGVPTMYIALINTPGIEKHDLRSIKLCISGASALPLEVQRKFEALTGGRLVEGYGLTETSPVTHVNPLDDPKKNRVGSIGIPVSDTQAKVVDLDRGDRDLPPGEAGELVIRGPQVMMGYWNKPDDNKVAIREGWFHTGDIAIMDPDGYFRIVDRKKDMIDVSGFKVWPREVEETLFEHPAIQEAAVVGIPDERSGEAVKAFVVLKKGNEGKVTAEELSQFCKQRIASFKAPKFVEFKTELPKTAVGKVLRRELKKEHQKELQVAT
ncbi:MAG TPA: long-chain fatty acid--CoA ligase [Candidatus Acidoferrales bacterium]|nr:long-chain fatty acid--CoA ligase [Candidatus Acidoferrales bacterium]